MLLFLNKQIGRVSWNIHTDIHVRLCWINTSWTIAKQTADIWPECWCHQSNELENSCYKSNSPTMSTKPDVFRACKKVTTGMIWVPGCKRQPKLKQVFLLNFVFYCIEKENGRLGDSTHKFLSLLDWDSWISKFLFWRNGHHWSGRTHRYQITLSNFKHGQDFQWTKASFPSTADKDGTFR